MSESVSFWLDNRNCAGTKAAEIGDQVLVLYRERYYVVSGGAAQIRGGKPMRFPPSSLPAAWKRALKGEVPPTLASPAGIGSVPTALPPKRERKKADNRVMSGPKQEAAPEKQETTSPPTARAVSKVDAKPASPQAVVVNCPYCTARHEIPVEKGKNGK